MEARRIREEALRMPVRRYDSLTILVGNALQWVSRVFSHLGKTLIALAFKEAAMWVEKKKDAEMTKIMATQPATPNPATAQRNLYGNTAYPPPAPVNNPYGQQSYDNYRPATNSFPGFNS